MSGDVIGVVGFVGHQNDGLAGRYIVESCLDVGGFLEDILYPAKPKACAIALDRNRLIRQNRNSS